MNSNINFDEVLQKALEEALRKRGRVNILIAGRSGVGKSTLINAVFQGNLATTGSGRPVTTNLREITKTDIPLSIFDSRGLEMADFQVTMQELRSFISERCRMPDPNNHIHVAWVCIAEGLERVEKGETQLVEMLADYVPVIGVVTKSIDEDDEFQKKVRELLPKARQVVRVNSIPKKIVGGIIIPTMGLQELVELTFDNVPEGQKNALAAVQKVDINLKKQQSQTIVAGASASAAAVAATPIPFSDALLIVPIQVTMLAGITTTFGLSFPNTFLSTLLASIVTGAGATIIGRTLVSSLLKLLPGVGSLTGGAIAAPTAAAITAGFGNTYIATLVFLFTNNQGEPPTQEQVVSTFKEKLALLPGASSKV
jgi:uncharacterized protein (DUF697 family)/GTP-binding protein EngB required for normal cell division